MISRVSFLKLLKETLRRHIAAVLITVLVFVIHIISFFLNVQNALDTRYVADTLAEVTSSSISPYQQNIQAISEAITELSYPNLTNGIIAMLVGAYLAFDFLRYMHSKRETDFYDSLPIRKQKWFAVIFTGCFAVFTLSCILTTGIELAIIYSTGYGCALVLQNMLWNLLCMIGIFLASWFTTALAMIMTGHSIIAFLGVGAFASYVPLILYYLVPLYAGKYFDTYISSDTSTIQYYFSPATLMYKTIFNWREWTIAEHWTYLVGCFVFAAVIGFISYLLFLRRPSETAGRAMAFEKINFLIRFVLVLPLSLYIGLFLSEMSAFGGSAWLIFGVVFGAFLIHGIMECIFQFDIRALISKKRQLLLSIILCLGFVFIFWADVFRYDAYMPDADDVETVYIETYYFDTNYNDVENWNDGISGEYVTSALSAVKDIINSSASDNTDNNKYVDNYIVTYQLKNGVTRRRCYTYFGNDLPKSLDELYATEEMKNDYCVFYHLDDIEIQSFAVDNGSAENFSLDLSEQELKDFLEIYRNEYTNLTLSQVITKPAKYELEISFIEKDTTNHYRHCYNVHSEFTNTIAFLEEHGVVSFAETETIKPENLEIYGGKYDHDGSFYISDANKLKELQKYMIVDDFMCDNQDNEYIYCDLRYRYNETSYYTAVFIKESDLDKVIN